MSPSFWQKLSGSPAPRRHDGLAVLFGLCATLLFVVFGALKQNHIAIPPNTLPWRPVDLGAPPGWIAHWQMNELEKDGAACRQALTRGAVIFTPIKDHAVDGDCGYYNVVRLDTLPINPRASATCGLAAGMAWLQQDLQQAAQAQMHARLTGIDQLGVFACRNVNSESVGPRSEHATANAIDIAGFRFSDGRRALVVRDYGKASAEGRFLDAAHAAACHLFNGVLGPRYNRLHAGHFHLDMGPYRICS